MLLINHHKSYYNKKKIIKRFCYFLKVSDELGVLKIGISGKYTSNAGILALFGQNIILQAPGWENNNNPGGGRLCHEFMTSERWCNYDSNPDEN